MLSIFQKDGSKVIVLLFLTLIVVIGVQSCNQEPVNVEPPAIDSKENFEKSLKQSSEMFRIATRLSTSNVSRSISIQNLDKDMQEQLVKQYGQDASKVYQSIKKDVFGKIDNEKINEAIKNIAMESANATKSSRIATQKLGELMSSVKNEITKGSGVTFNSKSYMDRVSNEYAQLAQLEMDKIRATVEKVDGKKMVPTGTYNSSEFAKKMNKEVIKIEKEVSKNSNLSEDDKKQIYQYNAIILASSSDLTQFTDLTLTLAVKNGKVLGWFSKLLNVFQSVVAAVIAVVIVATAVVVAIYCAPCIAAAASFLGVGGATAAIAAYITTAAIATGFVVGAYIGVEVGFAYICANPEDEQLCYDCVIESVTLGGIPGTGLTGKSIWDCQFCENKFSGFMNRNQSLCY